MQSDVQGDDAGVGDGSTIPAPVPSPRPRLSFRRKDLQILTDAASPEDGGLTGTTLSTASTVSTKASPSPVSSQRRFRTTEGFSSFAFTSAIGNQVATLGEGMVFGENAMLGAGKRNFTTKCLEDCEFIIIRKKDYQRILKNTMTKVQFFDENVPGCDSSKMGVQHPATIFKEAKFAEGHSLLTEGIATEPVVYIIQEGVVEFRRCEDPVDDPAREFQRMSPHKSLTWLSKPRPVLCWDALSDGFAFCSLATFPIVAYEPFTAIVASPTCTIYYATRPTLAKLSEEFLATLKESMMEGLVARLQRLRQRHPELFAAAFPPRLDVLSSAWGEEEPEFAARREKLRPRGSSSAGAINADRRRSARPSTSPAVPGRRSIGA